LARRLGKVRPMLKVVHDAAASNENTTGAAGGSLLDEVVRDGARQMLAAALQAEVTAYVEQFIGEVDEQGHRLVVRNGYHAEREVITAAGAVPVRQPRVNDRRTDEATGERQRFSSAILPAWARKSPRVAEVSPLLYLHGLSSSDFGPALEEFLGTSHGLSAATITRLTRDWQDERPRSTSAHWPTPTTYGSTGFTSRSAWPDKVCLLVMIGVRADGTKELIALDDGHRESTESWADLLRSAKRRGMAAPVLAVGDGALGFWAAVREVFPQTREQRCWFHKIANVLNVLPKSAQPGAKAAIAEIWNAEDREHAAAAAHAFATDYGAKWPKAVAKITDDLDELLVLRLPSRALDPAAHHQPGRVHLRHRQAPAAGHQGTRLTGRRCRDGVQADRVRPGPLANGQRATSGRPRPRRREVRSEANSSSDPTDQEVISKSPDTPIHRSPMSSTGTPSHTQHNEPTERTIQ
jgi:putative transposase